MFIAVIFTVAKIGKQPKCPSGDEWRKKIWYMCMYSGIFFRLKKEGNAVICNNTAQETFLFIGILVVRDA